MNSNFLNALNISGIDAPEKSIVAGKFTRWGKNNRFWAKAIDDGYIYGDYISCINSHWFPRKNQQYIYLQPKLPNFPKVEKGYNNEFAVKIWTKCEPLQNSLAQTYLNNRGITQMPQSIKFHPGLYHSNSGSNYPAMVAAITPWGSSEVVAIHRTYLNPANAKKADIAENKKMLGSLNGGAVRLTELSNPLVLAEGIETALSVIEATGMAAWAVLSTANYKNLILPPIELVQDIIIAADNDENGAGIKAAHAAAAIWVRQGRNVRIALPPKQGQDFNDLLRDAL